MEPKDITSSDSFCSLPWGHLYKNMDNTVKLCCVDRGDAIGNLENQTVEEIRNSKAFIDIRKKFLSGERLERCSGCYNQEKLGYHSYRQSANIGFQKYFKGIIKAEEPLTIRSVDYRPSNLCNLACKICSPGFSSRLIDPFLEAGQLPKHKVSSLAKLNSNRIDTGKVVKSLNSVDFIYFAGGEPMISEDHWELLKHFSTFKAKGRPINLKYNTNLTTLKFKDYSIEDYWPNFHRVFIGASLDGYGKEFEHIRTGASWDTILANLEVVKQLCANYDNIHLKCDTTFGWMNLKSAFKLHKFLVENEYVNLDDPKNQAIECKPLSEPYGASLSNTHPDLRDELLQEIEEYYQWAKSVSKYFTDNWLSQIDSLRNAVINSKFDEDKTVKWLSVNRVLDKKFKLNSLETFKFKSKNWNNIFYELYNR